jgi:hypothetical protein
MFLTKSEIPLAPTEDWYKIQKILYLKRPNPKDFAFATHISKIFSILCACTDSYVPILELKKIVSTEPPRPFSR